MGERHVLVLPRSRLVQIQLTGAQQHLSGLTINRVAIGVHLGGEGVELALALQSVERPLHHEWVQGPDVSHRAPVRSQVDRRYLVVEVGEFNLGNGVEPISRSGRRDVALNVRRLLLGLCGLHPEVLDDRRVDVAHHQRHECPEAHGQGG